MAGAAGFLNFRITWSVWWRIAGAEHSSSMRVPGLQQQCTSASSQLSPGVHTDHIKVEVCLDPACVNQLSGSPQTITITYQVGNNVPGSYGVSQVSVLAADVVADDPRALLYVAVPAAASANASSVAIVDPVNATITGYVPVGFDPGRLALSDEGSYLYVAERNGPHIARLALPGMTLDATIVLPNDVHGQVTWPVDVKVQPGAPKTIAVGRDFKDDTQFQGDGIVIYDDTTARPNIAGLDSLGNPLIRRGTWQLGSSTASTCMRIRAIARSTS